MFPLTIFITWATADGAMADGSLFGTLFTFLVIFIWAAALITVFGKVEVYIGTVSSVFVGIGWLGWTHHFDWSTVEVIREDAGSPRVAITMEGKTRVEFGSGLNDKRRYFVLNALKYLKRQM